MLSFKLFKHLLIDQFTFYCFGGGGGDAAPSGGNDNLWNTQSQKINQDMAMSGEMFDYWKKYSPGYLANANAMTQEAMDGTLTNRMRATAGADADQATAQGLASANRSLDRYGATLNPNAMAHDTNSIALQGAANKAGLMSKATQWGEGQKWARNQDAYGLSSGMPGNAVGMSNSAQMGLNGLSNQQSSANMTAGANAAGYGTMGATLASGLFSKADGGMIKVNGLAMGGMPSSPVMGWRERMAAMPAISQQNNESNPASNMLGGALPQIATEVAKPYLKEGLSAVKNAIMPASMEGTGGVSATEAAISLASDALVPGAMGEGAALAAGEAAITPAASLASTAAIPGMMGPGAALAAGEAAAGLTTTAAASTGAAASGAAAAGLAAVPVAGWIAGAALLASQLFKKADGGSMERVDMLQGGAVSGEGTETSDSIPAWLSDKEYVENAEAVGLPRGETKQVVTEWSKSGGSTKDLLERINEKGLKHRHGSQARMVDGEAKPNGLAGGGMLGIAMGAGADTYNRLEQQKERTRIAEQDMAIRQQSMDLQAADSGLRQQEHGIRMESANISLGQQKKVNAHLEETMSGLDKIRSGDLSPLGDKYNSDVKDGQTVAFQSGPSGSIANFTDASGKLVRSVPIGKLEIEKAAALWERVQGDKMRFISPEFYTQAEKASALAAERERLSREKALDREDRFRIAAGNNATTLAAAGIRAANHGGGGGAALSTAEIKNVDYLVKNGMSQDDAVRKVWSSKDVSPSTVETSKPDQFGGPPQVTTKTTRPGLSSTAQAAPAGIPQGATPVGVKNGKTVYKLSDGRLQIEQ